jgi:hypothetical protein
MFNKRFLREKTEIEKLREVMDIEKYYALEYPHRKKIIEILNEAGYGVLSIEPKFDNDYLCFRMSITWGKMSEIKGAAKP